MSSNARCRRCCPFRAPAFRDSCFIFYWLRRIFPQCKVISDVVDRMRVGDRRIPRLRLLPLPPRKI